MTHTSTGLSLNRQPVHFKSSKDEVERVHRVSAHEGKGFVLLVRHVGNLAHALVFLRLPPDCHWDAPLAHGIGHIRIVSEPQFQAESLIAGR